MFESANIVCLFYCWFYILRLEIVLYTHTVFQSHKHLCGAEEIEIKVMKHGNKSGQKEKLKTSKMC